MPTVEQLTEALWQAWYHHEFDEFIVADVAGNIDGNDHPVLRQTAEKLLRRIQDAVAV